LADKNEAISFAAYRALVDLFALDKARVLDPLMASLPSCRGSGLEKGTDLY
jgi:hypothetical protein